ncbi:MAG: hypothetical protein KGN36_16255 [Acidobacteriota bacterium]|nr:hypothetical protein [Acidobacteriota bacterium]
MAAKKKGTGKTVRVPKSRPAAEEGEKAKERIQKLVEEAIHGIEERLGDRESPPSIGDYLKVMQLQKEVEDEMPKEIKVTWIEPGDTASDSGE